MPDTITIDTFQQDIYTSSYELISGHEARATVTLWGETRGETPPHQCKIDIHFSEASATIPQVEKTVHNGRYY